MFCWGNTANGELGLGGIEDHHVHIPRELTFKDVNQVKYVACGKYHTVLVTRSGSVFSCGSNDYGQLGHGKQQKRFERVDGLEAYNICSILCGEFHSLAVNEWGQVFSWGASTYGQLGHGTCGEDVRRPRTIKALATKFVVQISCGYRHCLALTNTGELLSWGCCEDGQLGLGYKSGCPVTVPSPVKSLEGVPLAFIASGGSHSFAISKSGAVFGWGKNTFGQLGLNSETNHLYPAQLMTLRSIHVKYIACGEDFSVFLTQDGGVFTCGAGQYGQLGHGSTSNEILPRKVLELMGTTVTQVTCGRRHTLALVPSRGRIYAFGIGGAGQLGTKATLNSTTPQVVIGPWISPSGKSIIDNHYSEYVVQRIYAGGDQCFVTVTKQKDNIRPEDLRVMDESSQIWTLTLDRVTVCEEQPINEPVDQELLTYLETVLGSVACLNASFLVKDKDHFCCTPRNHGIAINEAKACFAAISRIENESLINLIRDSILGKIMSQVSQMSSSPDKESLRAFITIPFYHEFVNIRHAEKLQTRFARAVLNLHPEASKVLGTWFLMMPADYYEHLISVYKSIVINRIQHRPRLTQFKDIKSLYDEGTLAALDILSILNKLNHREKVPYTQFHIAELPDCVDIPMDYISWRMENRLHEGKQFCDYPFVFDPQAKTLLLQTDQALQMQSAINRAISADLMRSLLFSNVIDPSVQPFLVLHVTRNNLVNDTISQLSSCSVCDLKRPLKVEFVGEEAEDGGGVRKEFFLLLMKEILDLKYGMFTFYEETNAVWFSESSFEDEIMYFLIGLVCGLAIYNFTIIALPFPLALYKKLLGEPLVLQDLDGLSPTITRGLQQLLDYTEPDLEHVFCLNFEITREVFGETRHYPLKSSGDKIPVTQENKKEYVDLYLDFILHKSVERHFGAFRDAFHKVCGGHVLQLFHAQELMSVVIGNESYDWKAWQAEAEYKGEYSTSHPTIQMFWEVFLELPEEEKKKFLLFLTGTDRIPIQGMRAVKIIIQPTNDDKFLPVAHTCFNLLDLPVYNTKEKLRYKLLQAIQQHQGFSLV